MGDARAGGGSLPLERTTTRSPSAATLHARARDARARRRARGHARGRGARWTGFEFNSATHRYRVTLMVGGSRASRRWSGSSSTPGFGPDDSLYRELQVHECYATRGPMKLEYCTPGCEHSDCLTVPAFGADVLANPEPDFYILGHKSYGRNPHFLLETGFKQVADVIATLAQRLEAAPATS